VERGLIIHATRNYKALSFREILEQKKVENPERYVQPDIRTGGWSKFVRTEITPQSSQQHRRAASYVAETNVNKREVQQPKKGGRGWLHKV